MTRPDEFAPAGAYGISHGKNRAASTALLIAAALLAGCTSLGASGPSSGSIKSSAGRAVGEQGIALIDLDTRALERLSAVEQSRSLAAQLGDVEAGLAVVGIGDVVDIALWEAPPAVLFGAGGPIGTFDAGAQNRAVLEQVVDNEGAITVPFAGRIMVAGKSTAAIEREIIRRLQGRANDPQAVVRLANIDSRNVTVLGEVATSRRVPLGPRGERVLDVIADAGGTRQPVTQTTVQVNRGEISATMPLEAIIADPQQNVRLHPDDVVTVLHQPYSFIALGAVAQSAEIPFEGRGISLAQALARVGGLRDGRADIRGVFVFRLEAPSALTPEELAGATRTEDGRVPVVYLLKLDDASGFFTAQGFAMRDQDVLYVATAPGAQIRDFLSTVTSLAFSAITIGNVIASDGN